MGEGLLGGLRVSFGGKYFASRYRWWLYNVVNAPDTTAWFSLWRGQVADFILGGSKITADGDCSHEIRRRLLLGRKVMTNLDSILKSRDITLPTKVRLVKAMVFFQWSCMDVRAGL